MSVTVIGIGNPIMGDDGIGLELLRVLQGGSSGTEYPELSPSGPDFPVPDGTPVDVALSSPDPRVTYIDGGTSGMELLPVIQDAESLLVLDAVAGPGAPGSVVTLVGDQVPRLQSGKLSPHQVGLLDLLASARLSGKEPQRIAVVGIVAESVDLRVGLSPVVLDAVPLAAQEARALLDDWLA